MLAKLINWFKRFFKKQQKAEIQQEIFDCEYNSLFAQLLTILLSSKSIRKGKLIVDFINNYGTPPYKESLEEVSKLLHTRKPTKEVEDFLETSKLYKSKSVDKIKGFINSKI